MASSSLASGDPARHVMAITGIEGWCAFKYSRASNTSVVKPDRDIATAIVDFGSGKGYLTFAVQDFGSGSTEAGERKTSDAGTAWLGRPVSSAIECAALLAKWYEEPQPKSTMRASSRANNCLAAPPVAVSGAAMVSLQLLD